MLPVFVHCEGAVVHIDERTGSKKSRGQTRAALDIATELVNEGVDPTNISILSPYIANGMENPVYFISSARYPDKTQLTPSTVELIRQLRQLPSYEPLVLMGEASTVDSFQGQENDIIIVVMGTSFPQPGPGFTADPHRLNVLLTRQRCGLVVVGNVDLRGPGSYDGGWGGGRGGGRGGAKPHAFLVVSPSGERQWVGAPMLQHIHRRMIENGRVVRINARE
ncbi:AAA domain-containing protein [Chaetomium tenue]|uniref:AAA domain-containing protein n=1 Tax=Chaetomium tenue TaxID=1854479 RepID=A0ACB7PFZ8_9PEZI|nr:AAA domain-containing protein [Chaetomium globosum]